MFKKSLTSFILCLSIFISIFGSGSQSLVHAATDPSPDKVHMIKVGKENEVSANCFILQDYNVSAKKYVYAMIDTGKYYDASKIIDYLKAHNIKRLEYLFITHFHSDHYGGLKEILESSGVYVNKLVLPMKDFTPLKGILSPEEYTKSQDVLKKIIGYANKAKTNKKLGNIVYGDSSGFRDANKNFGDGSFTFYNLEPARYYNKSKPPTGIDARVDLYSLVILYRTYAGTGDYNGIKYLFTGDVYKMAEEKALLDKKGINNVDVLQLSHHGSPNANSEALLKKANPKITLVSRLGIPNTVYKRIRALNLKPKFFDTAQLTDKSPRASSIVIENRANKTEIKSYWHKVYYKNGEYSRTAGSLSPRVFK